ncbi:MAG: hypothetical protein KatS3mg087_0511 [Patescibacteria group bacterium]|nr:MAG: hypothetical protein KatS3mg087_0511 [Patescibacteria group bacterium]
MTANKQQIDERTIAHALSELFLFDPPLETVEEIADNIREPVVAGSTKGLTKGMGPKRKKLFWDMLSGVVDPVTNTLLIVPPYMMMGFPATRSGAKAVAEKIKRGEIRDMVELTLKYRYAVIDLLRKYGLETLNQNRKEE